MEIELNNKIYDIEENELIRFTRKNQGKLDYFNFRNEFDEINFQKAQNQIKSTGHSIHGILKLYNSQGLLIKKIVARKSRREINIYAYDSLMRLKTKWWRYFMIETITDSISDMQLNRFEYEYHPDYLKPSRKFYINDSLAEFRNPQNKIYTIDNNKKPIIAKVQMNSWEYKYDSVNNWISKIKKDVVGDSSYVLYTRQIKY